MNNHPLGSRLTSVAAALTLAASSSTASVVLSFSAAPASPQGIFCVDVFADVTLDDTWTAGGLRGVTSNGASLIHGAAPINPGNANHLVTMFSTPYPAREDPSRFTNGLAAVGGRYSPSGPTPELTAAEVNLVWFASPPVTASSPSVDGFVARIALNLSGTGFTNAQVGFNIGDFGPTGSVLLFRSSRAPNDPGSLPGTVAATFDVPNPVGTNWVIWAIPSPSTLALLGLGGLLAARPRR